MPRCSALVLKPKLYLLDIHKINGYSGVDLLLLYSLTFASSNHWEIDDCLEVIDEGGFLSEAYVFFLSCQRPCTTSSIFLQSPARLL